MSNETSSVNRPPLKLKGGTGRYRKFSCITYLDEEFLKIRLLQHENQIRAYAYAYHDKDTREDGSLKEPHIHILIVTHTTCTISAIRRWFAGFYENGKEITTTAQKMGDEYECFDYLTHSTAKAIADGKYQYDRSIVKSNNFGFFKADDESTWDNIQLACEMIMRGVSIHDCGKKFGRDFILHYRQIKDYLCDVKLWENEQINGFDELITRQDIMLMERSRYNENGR